MIEVFARLTESREKQDSVSIWQGVLAFQKGTNINQIAVSAVQAAGEDALHLDPSHSKCRFRLYNPKFREYCDLNPCEKRVIMDGDRFHVICPSKTVVHQSEELVVAERQHPSGGIVEIQNQAPLVFLDNEDEVEVEDVKPSLDSLIRATTSGIMIQPSNQITSKRLVNGREIRRGSTRHLPTDLIRQLEGNEDEDLEDSGENSRSISPKYIKVGRELQVNTNGSRKRPKINNNTEYDSEEDPVFKPRQTNSYRRNSSIVSEASINGKLEEGPCSQHTINPELCSHTKFKNIDALRILNSVPAGQAILEHLRSLVGSTEPVEIDHGIRCKLMNAIGTFLMHNADNVGLPTAVERRILVHNFLAQMPCQLEPTVFTNRGGTGCLDYWVRNRRKTTVREDGVFMVRGSKSRSQRNNKKSF